MKFGHECIVVFLKWSLEKYEGDTSANINPSVVILKQNKESLIKWYVNLLIESQNT